MLFILCFYVNHKAYTAFVFVLKFPCSASETEIIIANLCAKTPLDNAASRHGRKDSFGVITFGNISLSAALPHLFPVDFAMAACYNLFSEMRWCSSVGRASHS